MSGKGFRLVWLSLFALFLTAVQITTARDTTPIEPVDVRVMTFNIWLGGELVDFGQVVEAIRAARADIVGLQEPTGNTRRLADALGWEYASERTHIISRFPLIDPPGANGDYIYVQIAPGQVIAVSNVHLTSNPYGPEAVRDGETLETVLTLERETRLPEIEPLLGRQADLIASGMPLILTGDFNSPSHLDWTEPAAAGGGQVKFPVAWPVTVAVEKAGYQDTFRAAHPDPVSNPGITWTYGYPYPRLKPDEVLDRIDYVFAANVLNVVSSEIVGPSGSPNVDIGVDPFPSDHRGVVSSIRLRPVVPPLFVAAQSRVLMPGNLLVVRYHAPAGEDTDRIVIVPAGGSPVDDALMWMPPAEASFFGSITFGTSTLLPGAYEAVLVTTDAVEVSRSPFWVVSRDAVPVVKADKDRYAVAEPITISWENAPGMRLDWIGIYAKGDPDLYNGYLAFVYTQASVTGSVVFDRDILGEAMLPAGEYSARLMLDDGYSILAETEFSVTGP